VPQPGPVLRRLRRGDSRAVPGYPDAERAGGDGAGNRRRHQDRLAVDADRDPRYIGADAVLGGDAGHQGLRSVAPGDAEQIGACADGLAAARLTTAAARPTATMARLFSPVKTSRITIAKPASTKLRRASQRWAGVLFRPFMVGSSAVNGPGVSPSAGWLGRPATGPQPSSAPARP
jgi:hypothetical protein